MNPVTAKNVRKVLRLSDEGYSDTFADGPFETNPSLSIVHSWYRSKYGTDFEKGTTFGTELGGLDQALLEKCEDDFKNAKLWAEVFNLTEELNASFWKDMAVYQKNRDERKATGKVSPPDPKDWAARRAAVQKIVDAYLASN